MSSTARGAQRLPDDFYATPAWATRAILDVLGREIEPRRILEPTAGSGAIVRVLREWQPNAHIAAVELDEGRASSLTGAGASGVICNDFLAIPPVGNFDLAITNPPFSLAMKVIERSRAFAPHVVMLLRLNFLGSLDRAPFWRKVGGDVRILPRRPSFAASLKCRPKIKAHKGCGWADTLPLEAPRPSSCPSCGGGVSVTTTDSCEYAWFWFTPDGRKHWDVLAIPEAA